MRVFGIILAAGLGERMGGPKALLDLPDGPLMAQHAAVLRAGGAEIVIVMTRRECVEKLRALAMEGTEIFFTATPEPSATLRASLLAPSLPLADESAVVIVTPVDAMPVASETLSRLLAAIDSGADAAVPMFAERGGHPVALRLPVLMAACVGRTLPPLREVLRALGPRCVRIAVEDADVRVNLDTPADVVARFGVEPRFL